MKLSTGLSLAVVAFGMSDVAAHMHEKYLRVVGKGIKAAAGVVPDDIIKEEVKQAVVKPLEEMIVAVDVGGSNRRNLQTNGHIITLEEEFICLYDNVLKTNAKNLHPYPDPNTCLSGVTTSYFSTWLAACDNPLDYTKEECQYWEIKYHVHIAYPDEGEPGYGLEQTLYGDAFASFDDWAKDSITRSIEGSTPTWVKTEAEWATVEGGWSAPFFSPPDFGVEGDPHFKTWSGEWFDYMGACDLKLLHAPRFDGESVLDINIRTKIRSDYSYIENVALQLGEDTLEVASYGDYWLNGVQTAKLPATVGHYPLTFSEPSKKLSIFTIKIDDSGTIVVKAFKDIVSVKFTGVDSSHFSGSVGMVGSFDLNGKLTARDGKTEIFDPVELANEWQIRQDEPMLFQSANGPQHPAKCQLPDPAQAKGRRLGETIALSAAEKACAKYAADNQEACVHDVMAYGDLDLAAAGAA